MVSEVLEPQLWEMVVARVDPKGFPQERKCVIRDVDRSAQGRRKKGINVGEGRTPG